MKRVVLEFLRRGCIGAGFAPIVLAIVYLSLEHFAGIETLTVDQVCICLISLSALAFVAGGLNAIYQIERMPLMTAFLIHGGVLYAGYLVTYLLNEWLAAGLIPIIAFTALFSIFLAF